MSAIKEICIGFQVAAVYDAFLTSRAQCIIIHFSWLRLARPLNFDLSTFKSSSLLCIL